MNNIEAQNHPLWQRVTAPALVVLGLAGLAGCAESTPTPSGNLATVYAIGPNGKDIPQATITITPPELPAQTNGNVAIQAPAPAMSTTVESPQAQLNDSSSSSPESTPQPPSLKLTEFGINQLSKQYNPITGGTKAEENLVEYSISTLVAGSPETWKAMTDPNPRVATGTALCVANESGVSTGYPSALAGLFVGGRSLDNTVGLNNDYNNVASMDWQKQTGQLLEYSCGFEPTSNLDQIINTSTPLGASLAKSSNGVADLGNGNVAVAGNLIQKETLSGGNSSSQVGVIIYGQQLEATDNKGDSFKFYLVTGIADSSFYKTHPDATNIS